MRKDMIVLALRLGIDESIHTINRLKAEYKINNLELDDTLKDLEKLLVYSEVIEDEHISESDTPFNH